MPRTQYHLGISGAWTQKYDMCWSDSKYCKCCRAQGTEKHRHYYCCEWREQSNTMSDVDWDTKVEGFRDHIGINGSLDGISGRGAVCGWSVVHLDFDEEEDPWCAIHGTMWAGLEVQRTIRRAFLWAFTIVLSCLIGPIYHPHRQHGHH